MLGGSVAPVSRLAVLMLDGAERSLVLQLAADGELPAIAGLLDEGALVPVRTPVPYRAEYACTELLTGRAARDSRYWSTVVFDPDTYLCATVGSARRRPFYAAAPEGPVIVFDVPHSVLVEDLPGVQVVGWGGHDARFQHPRVSSPSGLMAEIDDRFGVDPATAVEYRGGWHQEWYIHALADALIESARRRAEIAVWLQRRVPDWRLFLMGLTEAHSAGHSFSHGLDEQHLLGTHPTAAVARRRFVEVYRALDDTVATIAAAQAPETVLAVSSSKGMQPNRDDVASALLLPELLHRLAFGRPLLHEPRQRAWKRSGHRPLWPDPDRNSPSARTRQLVAQGRLPRLKRRFHTSAPPGLVRAVQVTRGRLGRAGPGGAAGAGKPRPSGLLTRTPDGEVPVLAGEITWSPASWYRHLWPAMPWFALPSFSDGHVRLNLAGRERDGVVAPDAYDRTCDEIEERLRLATEPRTGEPLVDEVVRLRADDPLAPDGPGADLVVTWRLPADALMHPDAGIVGPFAFPRSGSHTEDGFLLVTGSSIPRVRLEEHPALDVPATLLALLGWPLPGDLGGSPVEEVVASVVD